MFIYLSKKIAIPNGVKLKALSWNGEHGWIACGGDNGLLKVLKLEAQQTKDSKTKGVAAPSNLAMNQTLEGHNGSVKVVTWNENYRKLTTSDQNGLIIVWMLYKGMWYEEMINNRNKSVVKDMKWTNDGQRICIIYEDGAVIVGSVDGNRIWGKEIPKVKLHHVEWSPDGRHILFCTSTGEVHIFDNIGNFISKLPIYCLDDSPATTEIIGIDWYGAEGYAADTQTPSLAVAFSNGRVQILRHRADDKPVLIDTGLLARYLKWNCAGTVLAVAGSVNTADTRESHCVQFYTPFGLHMRTLRVPGSGINGVSWEGGDLRIALAVDSYIYFANLRPDSKWAYFGKTLVYAFTKPERPEHCVVFWDIKNDEKYIKYVKKLLAIRAAEDHCVLVTKTEEAAENRYILILCNAIGTPVDSKYTEVTPLFVTMSKFHVAVASEDYVDVWQYRTATPSTNFRTTGLPGISLLRKDEGKECLFHVDDPDPSSTNKSPPGQASDLICAITCSENSLMIGRESGNVHKYRLPEIKLCERHVLKYRPQVLALNCTSTRLAIIDINGILSVIDMENERTKPLPIERKDVWDMKWSSDNPELFAMMEKTRMYIFRGLEPEEPTISSGYLCQFSDLKIKAVLLDELMKTPDRPTKDMVLSFEARSLRDTRDIIANVGVPEAYTFIDNKPHPRLWRILAEAALERLDFNIAEKSFVQCQDYQGIQFVKRLKLLDDKMKQKAEVAAYTKKFDEAEKIYRDIDRKDLAIQLRVKLGDFFRVVQLVQSGGGGGDDAILNTAWNEIGNYYSDRHKWASAVQYYSQCKNYEKLAMCYNILDDFEGLEEVMRQLPEGHPLLSEIGEMFTLVGISENAVSAYLKAGDVKTAIDCCVYLNQWDQAVSLAEHHNYPHIESLLGKYASHLLAKNKSLQAIELYRKATHHTDAAKLLFQLAQQAGAAGKPLRAKQLYVLGALQIEEHRKRGIDGRAQGKARKSLEGLLAEEEPAAARAHAATLDQAWRGAEAYHFFLLAQRQLYEGYIDASMKTSLRLTEYADIFPTKDIFSLIALTSYFNKHFSQCSRAFIKLETLDDISAAQKAVYMELALNIFLKNQPQDPPVKRKMMCPQCETPIKDWFTSCLQCGTSYPACVVTGRSILDKRVVTSTCKVCRHKAIESEQRAPNCALCHHRLA